MKSRRRRSILLLQFTAYWPNCIFLDSCCRLHTQVVLPAPEAAHNGHAAGAVRVGRNRIWFLSVCEDERQVVLGRRPAKIQLVGYVRLRGHLDHALLTLLRAQLRSSGADKAEAKEGR